VSSPLNVDGRVPHVGATLSFSGARPAGVDATGEVGIVAAATSTDVNSSVTNVMSTPLRNPSRRCCRAVSAQGPLRKATGWATCVRWRRACLHLPMLHYWHCPHIGILVGVLLGTLTASTEEMDVFAGPRSATVASDRPAAWSQTSGEWKRLEDRQVGYALRYPSDWSIGGQVAATEFATGSRCRSARVVDFEPAPGSGPGAQVRHSFVQVCAKSIEGGESLEDFMRHIYGASLARTFDMADFNGLSAYQAREQTPPRMIFTEIKNYRIQIYSSVVADLEKYLTRRAQVEHILASFSVI